MYSQENSCTATQKEFPLSPTSAVTEEYPVDGTHFYAVELLPLSLIWLRFHGATRKDYGERILCFRKMLFIIFKSLNYHNYAK